MIKNKKWICIFIAVVILIAGMWVDEVKADSVFLCPKSNNVVSLNGLSDVYNRHMVLSDVEIVPAQILCTRNTINSRQMIARIINSKKVIKLSMFFLCVAIFALLLSHFYTAERVIEYPKLCMRTVVLNYIHNTDGKK